MSAAPGGLAGFLAGLDKLPAYEGITFRGLASGAVAPTSTAMATDVMATSRDPRVATQNFTCPALLAALNRTGRDISALSAHPDEAEVVLRPGAMWRPLVTVDVLSPAVRVHILEELDLSGAARPLASWGPTVDDVQARVMRAIQIAAAREPVEVRVPGKFTGSWATELPSAE